MILYILLFIIFSGQEADLYQQGEDLLQKGDTLKALNIWESAKSNDPDPRIGFEYIRVATEANRDDLYQTATELYYWGLSADSGDIIFEELSQEVERLEPLLESQLLSRWRDLADQGDGELAGEIRGFWKHHDPTPGTAINERLLEHWERIAYARDNFNRSKQDPYGTDDRGAVYVRYGEPDLIREGNLQFNSSRASGSISDIMASGGFNYFSPTAEVVNGFVRIAREFYTFPEYVIWVYRDLTPNTTDNTIFLFGSKGNTGSFEELDTVEGFIPDRAFSTSDNLLPTSRVMLKSSERHPNVDNIRPGLILQLMYYDQLTTVDSFFGEKLRELEDRAYGRQNLSVSLGQEILTRARMDLEEERIRSPRNVSEYENLMREIPLDVYQYRMLDEQNDPYLMTFVHSKPQASFLVDYLYNYSNDDAESIDQISAEVRQNAMGQRGKYQLRHGVRIHSEHYREIDEVSSNAPVVIEANRYANSYLKVPYVGQQSRQLFFAELINADSTSSYRGNQNIYDPKIRGAGKIEISQPTPLDTNTGSIEMADVVMGYGENENENLYPFPFRISHTRQIPAGEILKLHLEIYNLQLDQSGITDFTLKYEVLEQNPGIIRWLDKYRSNTELTLNLQNDSSQYRENLEIKTRELDPGTYLLQLVATDQLSGQEVTREIEFEVTTASD